ncbi:HDOD domain-containing protein [Lautropia mirabilis]
MSLSSLLIGYRPVIDRDRRIMALQVRFASLGEEPMRLSELYRLMAGDRPLQSHTLLLSAPQAEFDAGLSDLEPTPGLWLEVPATVAEDPEHQQMLLLLHDRGMGMVLQGTPATQLPEDLLAVFRLAMVDIEDERRGKEGEPDTGLIRPRTRRNTAVVQSGVDSLQLMEQAFSMGAYAVCGWQIPPLVPSDSAVGSADYLGVLRLLSMVDRDASLREIEAVVRQEPEIAFRLLQHIDSMGFGLSVPVQNFQQAVMFMGYRGCAAGCR